MAATEPNTVVALVSGYLGLDGASIKVLEGDVFDKNDKLVKKFPALFGLQRTRQGAPVEQATAAPGEKR